MKNDEVNQAFEILLEEIEGLFFEVNSEGEKAFKNKDFDKAQKLIKKGKKIEGFRQKIKKLQEEFNSFSGEKEHRKKISRVSTSKLKKGLKTPEEEYKIPILEALNELGGSARMKDVLKIVRSKMKDILNDFDMKPLPSTPAAIRWENTAQWARNTMVNEGLLAKNSPHGVWEISNKGRLYLQKSVSKNLRLIK